MSDLKPCPFCGSKAREGLFGEALCINDNCRANVEAESVEVWNTRPLEDALLTRAEAAEQKLRELQERTRKRKYPDEKPEDITAVIGWNPIGEIFVASYFADQWWVGQDFQFTMNIVCWQLAPECPEFE